MSEVLIRRLYSAFAAEFVAYCGCSLLSCTMAATTNQRHAWRMEILSYAVCP